MLSRVGASLDPERVSGIVRKMRIGGVCIGAALIAVSVIVPMMNGGFEWTAYHGESFRSNSGTGLSYEATGLLIGAVFLVSPFTFALVFRSVAGEALYLNGTELTVVKPGRGQDRVFDLTRTRAQVRLDKVPGSRPGSAEARQKVGTHRPVLALFADSDGGESIIELANLRDRYMRYSQETRMLEGAMRFATDPAIQHAAGQLRTVARWMKLPVIHEAAPDAIPASPDDALSSPIPRTPVAVGVAAPEIEVVGSNPV
ncbi:MAG: hypothetical protein ACRD0P_24095 [Stackebrandtia sp.]